MREEMPKVCVLMSTYNGERYIKEQVDSILNQRDVEVEIHIRDDGSSDGTADIINGYNDERIVLDRKENIGCEPSFFELLYHAPKAKYYCFSDQDDYWEEDKLFCAVSSISEEQGAAIAMCNLLACDGALNPIGIIHSKEGIENIRNVFTRDILHNMHGCVLVWNAMLQEMIMRYRPRHGITHDGWVCAVANAVRATLQVDEVPHIRYRVHGKNVAGYATSSIARLTKGFRLYMGKNHVDRQVFARELLNGYENMMDRGSQGYDTVIKVDSYKDGIIHKIRLIQTDMIQGYKWPDRFFWEICILLGRY